MNLTTFSTEQLHLFVHTLEGISRQLDTISLAYLSEEDQKRLETLTAQAYVLNEQLTLEIAHRSLLHLHEQVGADQSTTLEIANHALVSLQKQARGVERT